MYESTLDKGSVSKKLIDRVKKKRERKLVIQESSPWRDHDITSHLRVNVSVHSMTSSDASM